MTLAAAAAHSTNNSVLLLAALLGIATVVVLITWAKMHPFLALILGSAVLGLVAGLGPTPTVDSFVAGLGSTVGSVGLLIALGAMIGGLLADSGGAERIVQTITDKVSGGALPWAMAGAAALIGIPLFFEVGVVLLIPIVLLVARRTDQPLMRVGIPALAGLSVLHGFIPPHPGPLAAIGVLNADLGTTLALGLLIAIPCVIVAGPLFGTFITKYVPVHAPALLDAADRTPAAVGSAGSRTGGSARTGAGDITHPEADVTGTDAGTGGPDTTDVGGPRRRPRFGATVATVLLPVLLMLLRAVGEIALDEGTEPRQFLEVIGNPVVALLAGVLFGMVTLGLGSGMDKARISGTVGGALPAIAGILLIVAAGGGFKQTLVDAGVGDVIADWAKDANISALLLAWLVAVGIRLATGSATVATITAAGIVTPLAAGMDKPEVALLVLAIGAGSLFFSHVNDAGFWLVKEYFGLTVGQTIKTWSVMETLISVVGLICVLLLNLVI
ncbi:MAG TPA: SLC13 family permease [Mycobacteriales bacterium]|jgi:GntP family gluconate:H+ symporter|nr:SLC13 family permease [Mycobacteriales bacterium]